MNKEEKATAVAELTENSVVRGLPSSPKVPGLPVNQVTELRKQLARSQSRIQGREEYVGDPCGRGHDPCRGEVVSERTDGLVIGYDDPVLPAKILGTLLPRKSAKKKITDHLGVLEGKVVQPAELAAVAKLPKKEVLDCDVVVGHAGAGSWPGVYA